MPTVKYTNLPITNRSDMISLPVVTRGSLQYYNAVLALGRDWSLISGWLHGTVTKVTDGDTLTLKLADRSPFSYPTTTAILENPNKWESEYIRLAPADTSGALSTYELRAGSEVKVRLACLNTPEIIYGSSSLTEYKQARNRDYCSKIGLDYQSQANLDKVSRVATETKDFLTGLTEGLEVWVYLDLAAKTTQYTALSKNNANLHGAQALGLDDYGRFLGEVFVVPSRIQSALFSADNNYKYIHVNPSVVSNASVYDTKIDGEVSPSDIDPDMLIPLALIDTEYFVSKTTAPGADDTSAMELATRINGLVWQIYSPGYEQDLQAAGKVNEAKEQEALGAMETLSRLYRMNFGTDGVLTDNVAIGWEDPSHKASDLADEYCWRNLVPAESETEDYENPTIDDRDRLDGFDWQWDEKQQRNVNRGAFGNHYCRIGDCTLPISPTAIRVVASASGSNTQTLRSKTSLKIQSGKTEKTILMTVFFTTPEMVDGQPMVFDPDNKIYTTPLNPVLPSIPGVSSDAIARSVEHEVWYRNGLRPLIAQLQHAPFLPIENELLNQTYKIYSVAFESLTAETVPGYPGMISVALSFREFDHTVFMPQEEYFGGTFCWPLFRWYYQRFMQESAAAAGRTYLGPVTSIDPKTNRRRLHTESATFLTLDETVLQMRQYAIDKLNNRLHPDIWGKSVMQANTPSGNTISVIKAWTAGKDQYGRWMNWLQSQTFADYSVLATGKTENIPEGQELQYTRLILGLLLDLYREGEPIAWLPAALPGLCAYVNLSVSADAVSSGYPTNMDRSGMMDRRERVSQIKKELGLQDSEIFTIKAMTGSLAGYLTFGILNTTAKDFTYTTPVDFAKTYPMDADNIIALRIYDEMLLGIASANSWSTADKKWIVVKPAMINASDWRAAAWVKTLDEYIANYQSSGIAEYAAYSYEQETNRYLALAHALESEIKVVPASLTRDLILTKASVTMKNTLVPMPILETGAAAYQYLGGGEKTIQLQFTTKSREQISELMRLFQHSQRLAREYRVAIVSSMVKIQHPLLQLFGVVDVLFENLAIETAGPELFTIDMTLLGFDKTQRVKEDLQSAEIKVNGQDFTAYNFQTMEDFSNLWDTSSYSSHKRNSLDFDYGHVDLHLRNLEIYPDLELPTFEEVNQAIPHLKLYYKLTSDAEVGYGNAPIGRVQMTRLPNPQNARFVDPDFYIRTEETVVDYVRLLLGDTVSGEAAAQHREYMILRDEIGNTGILQTPSPEEMSTKYSSSMISREEQFENTLTQHPITLSDATEDFLINGLQSVYYGRASEAMNVVVATSKAVAATRIDPADIEAAPVSPAPVLDRGVLANVYTGTYLSNADFQENQYKLFEMPYRPTLTRWGFFSGDNYANWKKTFFVEPSEGLIRGALLYWVDRLMPDIPEDKVMANADYRSTTIGETLLSPRAITKEKIVNALHAGLYARHKGKPAVFMQTEGKIQPLIRRKDTGEVVLASSFDPNDISRYRFGLTQRIYRPGQDHGCQSMEELYIACWCWTYDLYLYVRDFASCYETLFKLSGSRTTLFEQKLFYQLLDWAVYIDGQLDLFGSTGEVASPAQAIERHRLNMELAEMPVKIDQPDSTYYRDSFYYNASSVMGKWAGSTYSSGNELSYFTNTIDAMRNGTDPTELKDEVVEEDLRKLAEQLREKTESFQDYLDFIGMSPGQHDTLPQYLAENSSAAKVFAVQDGYLTVSRLALRKTAAGCGYAWVSLTNNQALTQSGLSGTTPIQTIEAGGEVLRQEVSTGDLLNLGFMLADPNGIVETWQDNLYASNTVAGIPCDLPGVVAPYGHDLRFSMYRDQRSAPELGEDNILANDVPDMVLKELAGQVESNPIFNLSAAYMLYLANQIIVGGRYPTLTDIGSALKLVASTYYIAVRAKHPMLIKFVSYSNQKYRPDIGFRINEKTKKLEVRFRVMPMASNDIVHDWSEYYPIDNLFDTHTYESDVSKAEIQIPGLTVKPTSAAAYSSWMNSPRVSLPVQNNYHNAWRDMFRYDRRGRLVRAFPTFQLFIINEGKWMSWQKIWDNFYGYNSVISMDLTKDRRFAADTLIMRLSNLYHNLSSYDTEISYGEWEVNGLWLWDALTNQKTIAWSALSGINSNLEMLKTFRNEVNSLLLRPGARLHLRVGYGANAAALPPVFNGTITELDSQDVITLVAQSDGIELLSKINAGPDETTKGNRSIIISGAEARDYICGMLTGQKGFFASVINRAVDGMFFSDNPLGLVHFGQQKKTTLEQLWGEWLPEIYDDWGEVGENIHSSNGYDGKTSWRFANGKTPASQIALTLNTNGICPVRDANDEPNIAILLYDRTAWDVVQTFAMVCPDYIATVIPFGYRSSLFFGKPWYGITDNYEYLYKWNDEWNIVERKIKGKSVSTLSQFRIYSGALDVINNGIVASEKFIYTNVVGVYGRDGGKQTGLIQIDSDIYPEKQKTAYVRLPLDGNDVITRVQDVLFNPYGTRKTHAENAALAALRDYAKEMYQGELIVLGDPSVKPYDTCFLSDNYTRMSGSFWVKRVTHQFSMETGFITSISPDLINVVDDKEYLSLIGWFAQIATGTIGIMSGRLLASTLWKKCWNSPAGAAIRRVGNKLGSFMIRDVLKSVGDLDPLERALLGLMSEIDDQLWDDFLAAFAQENPATDETARVLSTTKILEQTINDEAALDALLKRHNIDGSVADLQDLKKILNESLQSKNPQVAILEKVSQLRANRINAKAIEGGKLDGLIKTIRDLRGDFEGTLNRSVISLRDELDTLAQGTTIDKTIARNTLSESLIDQVTARLKKDMTSEQIENMVKGRVMALMQEADEKTIATVTSQITKNITTDVVKDLTSKEGQNVAESIIRKSITQSFDDLAGEALEATLDRIVARAATGNAVAKFGSSVVNNRIVSFLAKGATSGVINTARGAYKLVAYLGPQAIVATVADIALTVLVGNLVEGLSRALAHRQALVLIPLRYHGQALVAGIDGHKGAVMGDSPSRLDKFFAGTGFLSGFVGTAYAILGITAPDYTTPEVTDTFGKALGGGTTLAVQDVQIYTPSTYNTVMAYDSETGTTTTLSDYYSPNIGKVSEMPTAGGSDGVNRNCLSKSGVTGAQIDAVIAAVGHRNGLMYGMGNLFVDLERRTGVNALFLASIAALESGWGTTHLAIRKNNLYGIGHYESDGKTRFENSRTFGTVGESAEYAANLLKDYYLTAGAKYYKGTTIKAVGVNYCEGNVWATQVADIWENSFLKRINK